MWNKINSNLLAVLWIACILILSIITIQAFWFDNKNIDTNNNFFSFLRIDEESSWTGSHYSELQPLHVRGIPLSSGGEGKSCISRILRARTVSDSYWLKLTPLAFSWHVTTPALGLLQYFRVAPRIVPSWHLCLTRNDSVGFSLPILGIFYPVKWCHFIRK